jgi:N-methylhydantoinase B/oxoprolinase/acetone carboxylase alpha subunit
MFYTAEKYREDVTSGWQGGHGGPYFGGINQYSAPCAGMILDTFSGGTGGTSTRDGVDTGAHMMNPTSRISDVEIIELGMPFMYLARRNVPDSGGLVNFVGDGRRGDLHGLWDQSTYIWHDGIGEKNSRGHGIFGGYPPISNRINMYSTQILLNGLKNQISYNLRGVGLTER